MKVLILSTNTKHHTYFINKIAQHYDICGIVYERKVLKKDYPTGPFFDNLEDKLALFMENSSEYYEMMQYYPNDSKVMSKEFLELLKN